MAATQGSGSKAFLKNTLITVRKTFKKHICPMFKRKPSPSTLNMPKRSTSTLAKDLSISSDESQPPRSVRIPLVPQHSHALFIPNSTTDDKEHKHKLEHPNEPQPEHEHHENISQPNSVTKSLRIQRLTSRLPSFELPRTQTSASLSRKSTFTTSRLPTPTEPPKDALYSHAVYQKEGRRSVLSPMGRGWAMQTRATPRITLSKTNRPSTQTSVPSRQSSAFLKVLRKPSTQYNESKKNLEVKVPTLASAPPLAHIEKERASSIHHHLPRYYQARNRLSSLNVASLHTASAESTVNAMASPRRIRLTQGFEDLRLAQDTQQTKLSTLKHMFDPGLGNSTSQIQKPHLQVQTHEHVKENDVPAASRAHILAPAQQPQYANVQTTPKRSKLPVLSPSSSRRKTQNERMVLKSLPPRSSVETPISPVPSRVSNPKRRTVLTPQMDGRPQVKSAMPQEYWLGRFMTLTNAFHYEDSFNEPDIATGFEMPSSYSRPFQGSDDGDMAAYRVKRAFMVLENRCATEEAAASLRAFREAYIQRCGDQWMC
ncbi:uncharacterized protein DSM5745_08994 [Aspergillus mulundensis]|uniref:Uncharacterized protein n=1 Tax=Aspergillus mulundensis TaxID=1810919 RepID=A0A3D8QZL4_9EURO|nr:hypothetical protein DSM5745_08994 [Aspergillus mulundensis]RDW67128.1 hypothetical protein DSM5745_08994 [Aspergillus mulundensis]